MQKKIVVLGGGTGASMVAKGLKAYDEVDLSLVISMADDGGSTGLLRRELDVLPPGDVRACLLSLSHAEPALQDLFRYRFTEGALKGHNAGNILIAALEKQTGNFMEAVAVVSHLLGVRGKVIPVTLTKTALGVLHGSAKTRVMGEHIIDENLKLEEPREFFLEPPALISDEAKRAIVEADVIVIGPGTLSTSLIPIFLVEGVKEAIATSKAKIIYNANLTTTPGQTDGYTVEDYVREIERYLPRKIDTVLYHEGDIPVESKDQLEPGSDFVSLGNISETDRVRYQGIPLLSLEAVKRVPGDPIVRKALSHNSDALAQSILANS